jgi:hypothetical protein
MSTNIEALAETIKALSYDEMMEVADYWSQWTAVDADGNEIDPTVSKETMASCLSDWAEENLPKIEEAEAVKYQAVR